MTFYSNKCLYLCVDTLYTRVCILCSERSIYQPLFARVCRTAAPLQLLMLLLLGAAWLLPLIQRCDDAYDCRLINNIRQTFDVVLTYPDGSPPVWIRHIYNRLIAGTVLMLLLVPELTTIYSQMCPSRVCLVNDIRLKRCHFDRECIKTHRKFFVLCCMFLGH